jgi:hypothetical protein
VTRIPELEQELVAAAARLQTPRRLVRPAVRAALVAAAAAAAVVLGVVVAADNDHDAGRRTPPAGAPPHQRSTMIEAVDPEAGVRFTLDGRVLTVRVLASAPGETRDKLSGKRLRATCAKGFVNGPGPGPGPDLLQTRTRLWPAGRDTVRFHFPGDISGIATWCRLEDPVVGHIAFVKLRGAVTAPPTATLSPEQEVERIGNRWAPLFAAAPNPDACAGFDELHPNREVAVKYMGQPACEQAICERVGHRAIKNCTPLSLKLQNSFADARVQDVVVRGHQAAAKFSNGVTVEFGGGFEGRTPPDGLPSAWMIGKIGGNAGRTLFQN